MKGKNLVWGLFFVVAAALVILNATGVLAGIGFWSLILTLLLIPVFVKSILCMNFGGIFFPVAIAAIIYAEPFGIENLVPWPVLGCALFLSIGLSIIFPKKRPWANMEYKHDNSEDLINETVEGEHLSLSTRFGGSVKYVNSDDLSDVNIDCSFGGMKVYFDNAHLANHKATINLTSSFGGVEIFIPKEWNIKFDTSCSVGGVDEKGLKNAEKGEDHLLIRGKISFSGLTIIYV